MPENAITQRQRELLRTFRQATARRAEAGTAARHTTRHLVGGPGRVATAAQACYNGTHPLAR
jgi:hypothetical protein